jgi:Dullard-like phosphatase family protein
MFSRRIQCTGIPRIMMKMNYHQHSYVSLSPSLSLSTAHHTTASNTTTAGMVTSSLPYDPISTSTSIATGTATAMSLSHTNTHTNAISRLHHMHHMTMRGYKAACIHQLHTNRCNAQSPASTLTAPVSAPVTVTPVPVIDTSTRCTIIHSVKSLPGTHVNHDCATHTHTGSGTSGAKKNAHDTRYDHKPVDHKAKKPTTTFTSTTPTTTGTSTDSDSTATSSTPSLPSSQVTTPTSTAQTQAQAGTATSSQSFDPNSLWAKITGKILPSKKHEISTPTEQYHDHEESSYQYYLPPQRPEHRDKLSVVLDMDETLIHSEFGSELYHNNRNRYERYKKHFLHHYKKARDWQCQTRNSTHVYRFTDQDRPYDIVLDIVFDDAHHRELVFVHTRPHVYTFLTELQSAGYEIIIFTAALPDYANAVLDAIDVTNAIHYRLYRHHTRPYGQVAYVKDLRYIGRNLKRTVIVDNNSLAFLAQYKNGIPVVDYYGCDVAKHGKRDSMDHHVCVPMIQCSPCYLLLCLLHIIHTVYTAY